MSGFDWGTLWDGEWSGASDFAAIVVVSLIIAFVRVWLERRR